MSGREAYNKAVYLLSEADRPPYPGNTRAVLASAAALVSIAGSLRKIAIGLTRYTVGGTNTDLEHTPDGAAEAWNTRAERTCRNIASDDSRDEFVCSECGHKDGPYSYGPRIGEHCKGCGAKVVNTDD